MLLADWATGFAPPEGMTMLVLLPSKKICHTETNEKAIDRFLQDFMLKFRGDVSLLQAHNTEEGILEWVRQS